MKSNLSLAVAATAIALVSSVLGFYYGYTSSNSIMDNPDHAVADNEEGEPCKMVLVVRKDLPMTKGKIAAQCAHAALACYENALERTPTNVISWKSQGQPKIALQCDTLQELQVLQVRAARLGVVAEKIIDAGRTQIEPGSITVLGIGPSPVKKVNEITGHLKLL